MNLNDSKSPIVCFFILLWLIVNSCEASTWHGYSSLGLGFVNANHRQLLTLEPAPSVNELVNSYTNNSGDHHSFMLGFGFEKPYKKLFNQVELRLGLEGVYLRSDKMEGVVQPFVNGGNFDTRGFGYDIDNYLLLAKGSFRITDYIKDWGGYLDLGIGLSFNHLSEYYEFVPTDSSSVVMPAPFGNSSTNKLGFSIGVGLMHKVSTYSEILIGYRYLNTGNGVLSKSTAHPFALDNLVSPAFGHHMLTMTIKL